MKFVLFLSFLFSLSFFPPPTLTTTTRRTTRWEYIFLETGGGSGGEKQYCAVIGDKHNFKASYLIATNQKDEDRLHEWIGHHLLLGFDGVWVFDDYSENPVGFLDYLPEEARKKVLVFLRCPSGGFLSKVVIQKGVVDAAALLGAKWAMHLDADEFLILQKGKTVPMWLKNYKEQIWQISCNWIRYGTSFKESINSGEYMMEAYTYREPQPDSLVKSIQKCIYSPPLRWIPHSPHTMVLMGDRSFGMTAPKRRSLLGDGREWYPEMKKLPKLTASFSNSSCFVVHYALQSMETCKKRKIFRPRDDTGSFRKEDEICNHNDFNQVYDSQRMKKYAQALSKFLISSPTAHKKVTDYYPNFSMENYHPKLFVEKIEKK